MSTASVHHEFVSAHPVALCLGLDEPAQQIVGRPAAALFDHRSDVAVEFAHHPSILSRSLAMSLVNIQKMSVAQPEKSR